MRWKDNFYFYLSIAALAFSLFLIFHFYEMEFKWSETIDAKTVLQVLGTIFGAYIGAKTAGKYAIKSVEKQINDQETRERKREQRLLLKSLQLYSARSAKIESFLNAVREVVDKPQGFDFFIKDFDSFESIKKFLTTELANLEKIDISQIYSDSYFSFSLIIEDVSSMLSYIEYMIETMEDDDEDLYHLYKENYFNTLKDFKDDLGQINIELSNFKL